MEVAAVGTCSVSRSVLVVRVRGGVAVGPRPAPRARNSGRCGPGGRRRAAASRSHRAATPRPARTGRDQPPSRCGRRPGRARPAVCVCEVGDRSMGVAGALLATAGELPVPAGLALRAEEGGIAAGLGEVVAAVPELVGPPPHPPVLIGAVGPRAGLQPGAEGEAAEVLGHRQVRQVPEVEVRSELGEDLGVLRRVLRQVPRGSAPTADQRAWRATGPRPRSDGSCGSAGHQPACPSALRWCVESDRRRAPGPAHRPSQSVAGCDPLPRVRRRAWVVSAAVKRACGTSSFLGCQPLTAPPTTGTDLRVAPCRVRGGG